MRQQILQVFVLLAFLLIPLPAWAQQNSHPPLLLQLPASTRALGLGNAFVIGSDDPTALFYNPALISPAEGISGGVQRYGSAGTLLTLAGAAEWEWATGGVALGVQALSYGVPSEDPDQLTTEAALLRAGPVGASEMVASVGYARSAGDFELGIAAKWIEQRIGARRDATAAVDLGAMTEVRRVNLGLALQNLGPALEMGGAERELPLSATLGATLPSRPVGSLDVGASAAVTAIRGGEVAAGGGVEVAYWPIQGRTFVGRIGLRHTEDDGARPLTLGAAFWGDNLAIEYAYQGFETGSTHRIGVAWR